MADASSENANPSASASTSTSTSSTKFKRCRTGCLRCRKRRRKCDERKPRCQNCIDKNFDCNYGMQVTFLSKNSITVTAEELKKEMNGAQAHSQPGGNGAKRYDRIQFINEDPLAVDSNTYTLHGASTDPVEETQSPVSRSRSSLSSTARAPSPLLTNTITQEDRHPDAEWDSLELETGPETETYSSAHTTNITNDIQNSSSSITYRSTLAPWELDNRRHAHTHALNLPPVTLEPPITQHTFSAKDEFAVRGLLALGTQSGVGPGPGSGTGLDAIPGIPNLVEHSGPSLTPGVDGRSETPRVPGTRSRIIDGDGISLSPGFIDGIMNVSPPAVNPVMNFDMNISNRAHSISTSTPTSNPNSNGDTRKMKLLQHFRYIVAPWLDICDLNHPFGITALQMAVDSPSGILLSALMALSETCLQPSTEGRTLGYQAVRFDDLHLNRVDLNLDLEPHSNTSVTEIALVRIFDELRCLVSDVPRSWTKDIEPKNYRPLQSLVHSAYGLDLESAIYWVFVRIDLGKSLANNTPLQVPLPSLPLPSLALLCRTENTHERVAHYAQVLLWLCGIALGIYHQDQEQITGIERQSWLQIFEELNSWHYLRPQEFQPMVEVELDMTQNSEDRTHTLNPGSQFPMLLFTNGAGALCNQLYHTAMLLMLEFAGRAIAALARAASLRDRAE
ncbi:hypothetical protein BJX99DRAFT_252781 [Aspergillus californicus]